MLSLHNLSKNTSYKIDIFVSSSIYYKSGIGKFGDYFLYRLSKQNLKRNAIYSPFL